MIQDSDEISAKVEAAERLSFADGLALYATDDLTGAGKTGETSCADAGMGAQLISTSIRHFQSH